MSIESRRVLRRIDSAIADLQAARQSLIEEQGPEPDLSEVKVEIDSAIVSLNLAGAICDEQ